MSNGVKIEWLDQYQVSFLLGSSVNIISFPTNNYPSREIFFVNQEWLKAKKTVGSRLNSTMFRTKIYYILSWASYKLACTQNQKTIKTLESLKKKGKENRNYRLYSPLAIAIN